MAVAAKSSRQWAVRFALDNGGIGQVTIPADSAEAAVLSSGIIQSRILSVKVDPIAGLTSSFMESLGKPPLKMQAEFLTSFSAVLLGGVDSSRAFDQEATRYPLFAKKVEDLKRLTLTSDKMAALKFDPYLVNMAKIGERSNRLTETIGKTVDDLLAKQALLAASRSQMVGALVLVVVALAVVIGLPQFMHGPLEKISNTRGVNFPRNFFNNAIDFIYDLFSNKFYYVVGTVAAIAVYWRPIWIALRNYWPLKHIYASIKAKAGIEFVAGLQPLFEAGEQDMASIEFMLASATGEYRDALLEMADNITKGKELGESFTHELWPLAVTNIFRNYSKMPREDRMQLFKRARPMLDRELLEASGKTSQLAKFFGMGLALFAVAMQFGGLMLPLMKIRAG